MAARFRQISQLFAVALFATVVCFARAQLLARPVPLCVRFDDPNFSRPPYDQFQDIIRDPGRFYNTKFLRRRTDPLFNAADFTIFDSIEFNKIKLDLTGVTDPYFDRVTKPTPLGIGNTFNNWIHIVVKTKMAISGLLLQAIHGPIGLPFGGYGEFRGRFGERCKCTDCNNFAFNFVPVPCTFKSKASLRPPEIFTFHELYRPNRHENASVLELSPGKTTEVHLNFNYIDIKCHRGAAIQFLVIAIRTFPAGGAAADPAEVEAAFTVTFNRRVPVTLDGVPYPFHPDLCTFMSCGESMTTPDPYFAPGEQNETLLRFNYEYDTFLMSERPDYNKISPPGPFKCLIPSPAMDTIPMEMTRAMGEAMMYEQYNGADPPCNCARAGATIATEAPPGPASSPTPAPWRDSAPGLTESQRPTNEPDFPTTNSSIIDPFDEVNISDLAEELKQNVESVQNSVLSNSETRAIHGQSMLFAFSFFSSMSVFMSRFDKDILPGIGCCAKGMWLWGHILFAFLSLATMWTGLAILLVLQDDQVPKNEVVIALHALVGFIAMILFHADFLFGWIRPVGRKFRGVYIKLHALIGYASKVAAVGAMMLSIAEGSGIGLFPLMILVPECLSLLLYAVSTIVQRLTDKKMELKHKRRICPYVEHKVLTGPVPATCRIIRNLILVLHLCILLIIVGTLILTWPGAKLRSYYDLVAPGNFMSVNDNGS